MFLTVKEMELLCIFYDGTLEPTLDLLRHVEEEGTCPPGRASDLNRLIEKLSQLEKGGRVCLEI
ncbi:MAG: hypothetical protein FWD90_09660 [Defluviitaleaceae bacterium]|nr:hypothetical protein [Defluviitaleaceae bacterium]